MGSRSTYKYPFPENLFVNKKRMIQLVEDHWFLNRTAVSEDTDQFVNFLANEMDAEVLEVKSGSECLTWQTPKHWKVRKAQLRTISGKIIADTNEHPLHLWTHSVPFHGEVSRAELLENHIVSDPDRPDEIVYEYRNGYRFDAAEWGFSLQHRLVETLTDKTYFVEIDADLDTNGTLKVVDAFLPGELDETICLMAHTCHPGLVSDGIACIAAAVELYHYLKSLPKRRYSYRFLFGPEYFAAAAYLEYANKKKIQNLRYGLFLDMLSNHEPAGFQHSMQGNSLADKIAANVFKSHTGTFLERDYRQLWGNDEMFYNGPGFEIPTLGVGRGMHREYHYHTDNLENMNTYHMLESIWLLWRIVEVFETDFTPVRTFEGPLYQSRYNLYVDPSKNRDAARKIEKMFVLIDGENSCMDIANILDIDFYFIRDYCRKMVDNKLITIKDRLPKSSDCGSFNGHED